MARPVKTFPSIDPSLTGSGFQSNRALARCAKAWQRTFELASVTPGDDRLAPPQNDTTFFARDQAATAFRDAMPPLCGQQNVSDFIACVTFAMLKDIFDPDEFTRLLQGANMALKGLGIQSRLLAQAERAAKSHKKNAKTSSKSGAKSAA